MGASWFVPMRPSSSHCEACGRVFAAGHLPRDGTLICRDCRDDQQAGLRPQSAASSFEPMRPSTLHCESCERVFAAGHLPTDGVLICRDCRDDQQAGLFEVG